MSDLESALKGLKRGMTLKGVVDWGMRQLDEVVPCGRAI